MELAKVLLQNPPAKNHNKEQYFAEDDKNKNNWPILITTMKIVLIKYLCFKLNIFFTPTVLIYSDCFCEF